MYVCVCACAGTGQGQKGKGVLFVPESHEKMGEDWTT